MKAKEREARKDISSHCVLNLINWLSLNLKQHNCGWADTLVVMWCSRMTSRDNKVAVWIE